MTYQEAIDYINQLDTAHLLTYFYMCILLVTIMLTIYTILTIVTSLITKKKKQSFLEKQSLETQNIIRQYEKINIFTKRDNQK